ncbi:3-hydroxyacyl-ACP dehydratase FabZ [Mesorhizobium retamae]|uniref:3-hydroxyacyl-[acyl-carrier-protein] dehydratase FabZ n=1 Tax=Mesorhizobium retamae TaxID=2912854 RepID=A0ABS9Q8P9_9HYPH|nr:3-hydroxyacyl-ACP dehydratase FabZ [Mesorhizobium sp. IRAMC:0171]MCG7503786.1 3-hydroxyacyl-ACP dehydratase FabZ [Mesorhizobium sp. IRAMC:0171]
MADTAGSTLETVDLIGLTKILPHRYPFLMIDRIVDIDGDNSAIGVKNVTINEPHFTGHFPEHPVMPGVLILEAMAQTAGAICIRAAGAEKPSLVYLLTIDGAKFRKPVAPGDQLFIHVRKLKKRGNLLKYACEGKVDGVVVAEAEVQAMMVENERP